MKIKHIIAFIIAAMLSCPATAQIFRESVFGIDNAPQRWGRDYDQQIREIPYGAALGYPSDAVSLRFADGDDTTEIIIICDAASWVFRCLRVSMENNLRTLTHMGIYGLLSDSSSFKFHQPNAIAVTSTSPLYNPAEDDIYVADKLGHRLVKLDFFFDPADPEADHLIFEDTITTGPAFYPFDIEYINFNTGNREDNKLIVLDDMNQSLVVLADNGTFLCEFDLEAYDDTISTLYESVTYRILNGNAVAIYLADRNSAGVRLFHLSSDNQLTAINYLNLGDRLELGINKVYYNPRLGLWALDWRTPTLFLLASDLSRIMAEVELPDIEMVSLNYPFNICELPGRIVVFENAANDKGIISFAYNRPHAKEAPRDNEVQLPIVYSLEQNYPNPFNRATIFNFSLAEPAYTSVVIYNLLGQQVKTLINEYKPAGDYSIRWDGTNESNEIVATGLYFYRIKSGNFIDNKKMIILK